MLNPVALAEPPLALRTAARALKWDRSIPRRAFISASAPRLGLMPHLDRPIHRQMNLLLSRLDRRQRRWYAALESARIGHGADRFISLVTGLHVETNCRAREELTASLEDRSADRVRLSGDDRIAVAKAPRIVPLLSSIVGPRTS